MRGISYWVLGFAAGLLVCLLLAGCASQAYSRSACTYSDGYFEEREIACSEAYDAIR